jgi:rfaE bifunctional protein kinase chain/domain/rfaE bifunctional protein nucleotidyltransferase chain/domain
MKKVYNFEQSESLIKKLKKQKKKIVLCHGVFDLVHIGHIKHFTVAKSLGEVLIVSITKDEFINKGPGRPVFNHNIRAEYLSGLSIIDYVIINDSPTSVSLIKRVKPNIYCKGFDYKDEKKDSTKQIINEKNAVKLAGGSIHFTNEITNSSSSLLNNFSEIFNNKQKKIINQVKKEILKNKDLTVDYKKFSKLKILVIGETIIDHYYFGEAIGKSGKDPIIALQEEKDEKYIGGAATIASHISSFSKNVTLMSIIGEKNTHKEFLENNLSKHIRKIWIMKKNAPTIIKKRYIDKISGNKLLSTYVMNDRMLSNNEEEKVINLLTKKIKSFDLVLVSDYGHGFLSKKIGDLICKKSSFLSFNAQINAANRGYHTMKNYFKSNLAIINEAELRHEMRDKNTDIKVLMKRICRDLKIEDLVVTMGRSGSILLNKKLSNFYFCEAFATKIVDKVGSGDAMLSVISLFLKCGFGRNFALLAGSLAAAQSLENFGNRKFISFDKLKKTIEHILK